MFVSSTFQIVTTLDLHICNACQETNGVWVTWSQHLLSFCKRARRASVSQWASLKTRFWSQTGTAFLWRRGTKDRARHHSSSSSSSVMMQHLRHLSLTRATASLSQNTQDHFSQCQDGSLHSTSPGFTHTHRPDLSLMCCLHSGTTTMAGHSQESLTPCTQDGTFPTITISTTTATCLALLQFTQDINTTPPGSARAPWPLRVSTERVEATAGSSSRH